MNEEEKGEQKDEMGGDTFAWAMFGIEPWAAL